MTDQKISQFTDGGIVQTGDILPAVRGGSNVGVVPGSAAGKAASDPSKDTLASVSGATSVGNMAVFADENGTITDGGSPAGIIVNATLLSPVLTTDLIPVVRGGQIYLAVVEDVLAAQPPSGGPGSLVFSTAGNSGLLAGAV